MEKVTVLQKIKWSIVFNVGDDFSIFVQSLEKLLNSVDCRRSEIFLLGTENSLFLNTFSSLCEKTKINYSYADNYAHAVSIAKGNLMVYITDHVVPSKNFLVKLAFAMDNFDTDKKVMAISPISNDSYPSLALNPSNIDDVQAQLAKAPKNNIPWALTLKLLPFCIMFRKSMYDQAGLVYMPIKDQILNVIYSGGFTVAANDTIVYHFSEHVHNDYEFFDDVEYPTRLGILYRIRINDEYNRDIFVKSLENSLTLSENIYVLDDNSKIKMSLFLREKHPELWSKITKYEKFSRPYDEKRDFNDLISWAENDGCTWAFALQDDEIPEKKTLNFLTLLLSTPDAEVMAYRVSHYFMWDNEDKWRFDAPWGGASSVRIFRIIPGRRIVGEGTTVAQTGYCPAFPSECVKDTSLRIKNHAFVKPEARLEKKLFYEKLGLQKVTFDHFVETNGAHYFPWVEDSTLSIYTPTNKNKDILKVWIDRIAYFADEIVVGNDSNSLKDEDLAFLNSYKNVKVVDMVMGDDFGEGRNTIIKQCSAKWILQLDIDEQLEDVIPVRRLLDMPVTDAWMFNIPNIQKDGGHIITETLRLFKNKDNVQYLGRLHETIDDHVKKNGWKLKNSPIKIIHYGYTLQSNDEAFVKMQRYLKTNIKQMKENPAHALVYYNLALHFLEDDLLTDAVKLLNISVALNSRFPLSGIELSKTHLKLATKWMEVALRSLSKNHPISLAFSNTLEGMKKIQPKNYLIAPGHCRAYFNAQPEEAKWLREHVEKMEKGIENTAVKQQQAKADAK